jgi:hypothetical protein
MGLTEIVAMTALGKLVSARTMKKLGMMRDCEFDHPPVGEGNPLRRHVLYRLSRP